MNRRGFLTGPLPAACLPLVGGCLARAPGNAPAETAAENQSEPGSHRDPRDDDSRTTAHGSNSDADPTPALESKGPVRGESDTDVDAVDVEDDEDVEYLPEDDAVRYVAAWRHTNQEEIEDGEPPEREPVYETVPFERWGETNCLTAAARAAADHAAGELGVDGIGSGISSGIEGRDTTAVVSVSTILDRDGEVVSEAPVAFEALVAATPATVHATYRLDDREYEMDAPIFVRYGVMRQQ